MRYRFGYHRDGTYTVKALDSWGEVYAEVLCSADDKVVSNRKEFNNEYNIQQAYIIWFEYLRWLKYKAIENEHFETDDNSN